MSVDLMTHPLFDRACRLVLRRHGGQAILDDPDAYEMFKAAVISQEAPAPTPGPTPTPPAPTPSGHPILDAIAALLSNPQFIAMLISIITALIPKGPTPKMLAGLPSLSSLLDLIGSGGAVMQAVVKGLTAADVGLSKVLEYLPVVATKISAGVSDAKQIVDEILGMLPTGA